MILDRLVELFLRFPGIGPRQAKRFAYFVSAMDSEYINELASLISRVKNEIGRCNMCFRTFSRNGAQTYSCELCENPNRNNKETLLVVEKDADLEAIEVSGAYNGLYFVLGGVMPTNLSSRKSRESVRLKELNNRIEKAGEEIKEIILATSATLEGELTARVVEDQILAPLIISKFPEIKVTRLGRGLSTGSELEYSDRDTIVAALGSRR